MFFSCFENAPEVSKLRFVWIATATSKRHLDIIGDPSQPFVVEGNCLTARFSLLAMVAAVFGAYWMEPTLN